MKLKKILFSGMTALIALTTVFGITGCSNSGTNNSEKTYKIVSDSVYAPFEFENSSGVYEGIDVELLARIAALEGFKYEISYPGFDAAIQSVAANQADGAIAGMSITEKRAETYDFSKPYYKSSTAIAVAAGNTEIKSYSDLKGKKVGAKTATSSETWLEAHKDEYGYTIQSYEEATPMYEALNIGAIDAFMDDTPVTGYGITQGKKFDLPLAETEKAGDYGFAVKKGENSDLLDKFNSGLQKLMDSGEYTEILQQYGAEAGSEL
jgi:polar amino acid transport system substrate-binding protein